MSTPSESCVVQIGTMAASADAVCCQLEPAMEPLSSMRKTVSNFLSPEYCSAVGEVSEKVPRLIAGAGAISVDS